MSSSKPMSICIAGGGIAGFSMAIALRRKNFKVEVFEGASEVNEIGAGIQAQQNVTRILSDWGMLPEMEKAGLPPRRIELRRYADGSSLAALEHETVAQFGFPQLDLHRAVWQKILYDTAVKLGVQVSFNKRVETIDISEPALIFLDGSKATGDLIIGADGVRSRIRNAILAEDGQCFELQPAPQCTYRMLIPGSLMESDSILASLMEKPSNIIWCGPKTSVTAFVVRTPMEGLAYNFAMTRLHSATPGVWSEAGNMEDVRTWLSDFEPTVQRILDRVDGCLKWGLTEIPPLTTWGSKNGRVVLCGDAAHAMFPHIGQGASQSIEDAAVLAELLAHAQSIHDLPPLIHAYQDLRKPRAEACAAGARQMMNGFLLEDGHEQEARDQRLKTMMAMMAMQGSGAKVKVEVTPSMDAHPTTPQFRAWLYGTDVVSDTRKYISSHLQKKE